MKGASAEPEEISEEEWLRQMLRPLPYRVFLTPEMAAEWAVKFRVNRTLRPRAAEAICRDILAGRWRQTGDTIKKGDDGLWDDGQHRVHAVILAGQQDPEFTGIWVLVQEGLTEEDRPVIDSGISRSFADVMRMRGVENYNLVSAVTRRMLLWDAGNYLAQSTARFSHQQLDEYLSANSDEILSACKGSAELARSCYVSASVYATVAIILARIDADAAEEFLTKLVSGADLSAGDPVKVLRDRLIKEAVSRTHGQSWAEQEFRRALCFSAWNRRTEKQIIKLQISRGKLTNKNYPVPKK